MILKDHERQISFRLDHELYRRFRMATAACGSTMTGEIIAFLESRYPAAPQRSAKTKKTKELDQASA